MTTYTKTGDALLQGLSTVIDDLYTSTTTAGGNTAGTTLEDDRFEDFTRNALVGRWIRITASGDTSVNEVRRITANEGTTVTVNLAFSGTIATSKAYEMHKWEPRLKFAALDTARIDGFPSVSQVVYDDTFTPDGRSREVVIPPTILRGPVTVLQESSLASDTGWNFLKSSDGQSTNGWTLAGAGGAASVFTRLGADADVLVPKYDPTCMQVKVAVTTVTTLTQVVGDMENGVTALNAAGRYMTYAKWVYARVASRITLLLIDDDGTVATSASHAGRGWELLKVSGTIKGSNATTLSVQMSVSSGAVMTIYWNRAWLLFGELPSMYHRELGSYDTRRDGSAQSIELHETPNARLNLRLIGWDYLTELGTTAATQATNTMEVDDGTAQLLYAFATRALFRSLGISADAAAPGVAAQIAKADEYQNLLNREQRVRRSAQRRLSSPWDGV